MSDLEYEIVNGVGWIRLNRPERKNAFTLEMIDEWAARIEAARSDPKVGAIVVAGNGGSFCSGADLAMLEEAQKSGSALEWKSLLWDRVHKVAFAVQRMDKLVVAAIDGTAVGAGMDMALMCDMRFGSSAARFCEGYIKIGAVPGDGGCYFLPRIVGIPKALELLLSGDTIDAAEALRIGLLNRVYPDGDTLLRETQAFAEKVIRQSPVALRLIKRAVYQCASLDLATSLDLISSHMGVVQTTADSVEAFAAMKERRPPKFEGR